MEIWVRKTLKILALTPFIIFIFWVGGAKAAIVLMDGRLQLKGSIEEFWILRTYIPGEERAFHDSNINMLLSNVRFETFYKMVQQANLKINLQCILRYYYEGITDLDRQLNGALPPGNRREFQTPSFRHDDPINEFFIDIFKGPWQARIGKQIVTWGETELKRTTDVINPLDLRHGNPGIMPFEDLKVALWMLRLFYTVPEGIPGNLLLETIFIPGDHQMMRIPPEGTMWGPGLGPGIPGAKGFGNYMFTMIQGGWKDDAPHRLRNIKYYQWGMRLRGLTKGVDWTLQYFDAVDSLPVGIPDAVNQQATAYIATYFHNGMKPSHNVPKIADRVWDYRRTRYVGATAQWFEENITKSVIRAELSYQIGKHYNTTNIYGKEVFVPYFYLYGNQEGGPSSSTSLVTDIVKKDAFGYGLGIDKKVMWPWLMQYNDNRSLSIGFQVFQDWIFGHHHDLQVSGRGRGDRNSTALTLQLMTDFFHQELTTVWKGYYDTSGTGYNVVVFAYGPGIHWRYEIGSMFFFSFTQWDQEAASYDKDCFYFRLKYEW